MTDAEGGELALLRLLAEAARGPRREGLYAVWLTVRVARDLLLEPALPSTAHERRVSALQHRLATLTLSSALRRVLPAALEQLRSGAPAAAALVLGQLAAPAREALGAEAGDAVQQAARVARRAAGGAARP